MEVRLSEYFRRKSEGIERAMQCFDCRQLLEFADKIRNLEDRIELAIPEQKSFIEQMKEDETEAKCWGDISKQAVDMMIDVMNVEPILKGTFNQMTETGRRELRECFEQVLLEAIQQASAAER